MLFRARGRVVGMVRRFKKACYFCVMLCLTYKEPESSVVDQ